MVCIFHLEKNLLPFLAATKPGRQDAHLEAHEDVEEVVHARQVLHILEDGHEQRGGDGDGAREQHPGKAGPAQVQEALGEHREAMSKE